MPEHSARSMRYDSRQNKRLNAMSTQRSVTPRSCVVSQCTGRSGVRANVCVQDLSIIQLFVQPWTTESLSQLHASCMMQDVSFRLCNCRFQVILLENLFRELTARIAQNANCGLQSKIRLCKVFRVFRIQRTSLRLGGQAQSYEANFVLALASTTHVSSTSL